MSLNFCGLLFVVTWGVNDGLRFDPNYLNLSQLFFLITIYFWVGSEGSDGFFEKEKEKHRFYILRIRKLNIYRFKECIGCGEFAKVLLVTFRETAKRQLVVSVTRHICKKKCMFYFANNSKFIYFHYYFLFSLNAKSWLKK